MPRVEVQIPTTDGRARRTLHGIGGKIAAAASFHGGRLAVADDPSSPHLAADRITAAVYVAGAVQDNSFYQARL